MPSFPKPEKRSTAKRRAKRARKDRVSAIREYVFEREAGICRCCRFRPAESMHEIRPRSLGGKVSKTNSIAVCGSGTTGCHGMMQTLRIRVEGASAEGGLIFVPLSAKALDWLRLDRQRDPRIESGPTPRIQQEHET
jgi:hypothetical protein